jgi:hypothetical protein
LIGKVLEGAMWLVQKVLPTSAAGWRVVAVVGAFVALGAGVLVSLARGPRDMMERK